MLKNLSNFFARGASKGNVAPEPEWETAQSPQSEEPVDLEVLETITDLKCFLVDGKMEVGLYGSPSELPDGWVRNCPWDSVFRSYPNLLPLDQRLSLREAHKLVPLVEGFGGDVGFGDEAPPAEDSEVSDPVSGQSVRETVPTTAFRDWIQEVSDASGYDAKAVKTVAKALASEIQRRIDAGDSFKIGPLRFRSCPFSNNNTFTGFFSRVTRS